MNKKNATGEVAFDGWPRCAGRAAPAQRAAAHPAAAAADEAFCATSLAHT